MVDNMEVPKLQHLTHGNTRDNRPRPSFFVTGQPGVGKTLLLAELALKLANATPEEVMVGIHPLDEEGLETLHDRPFHWFKIPTMAAQDELYQLSLKIKPKAIIMDNLGAAWWMAFKTRCPDGVMPEDHGKTWNKLAGDVMYEIVTRFKMHPWVQFFGAGSLVLPMEDTYTLNQDSPTKGPKIEKLQTVLPGQLRGTIYGLFSYCLNIKTTMHRLDGETEPREFRVCETRPFSGAVAKVRAPLASQPKPSFMYDLAHPKYGIERVISQLKIGGTDGKGT